MPLFKEFEEQILKAERRQLDFWGGKGGPPLLLTADAPNAEPAYNLKEIHNDSQKMFANEMSGTLRALAGGADAVPSVRANMGCPIFPSLLGVVPQLFEDKMPWVTNHLSKEQIAGMEPGNISITEEFGLGLKHMEFMAKQLSGSPVRVYPMDLQGPFDMAHILYGNDIFYDIYDDPGFLHHLLELCCHAIIYGMEECLLRIPGSGHVVAHYNNLIMPRSMGGIKISEDTSTLISPDAIDEFVLPYTKKVLNHFGGGYIHYCGKNDYLLEAMLGVENVHAINFGNPEKHDMDTVLGKISHAGKAYYGTVPQGQDEGDFEYFSRVREASLGRVLLMYDAGSRDASSILEAYSK